jgi:hypothetical protein
VNGSQAGAGDRSHHPRRCGRPSTATVEHPYRRVSAAGPPALYATCLDFTCPRVICPSKRGGLLNRSPDSPAEIPETQEVVLFQTTIAIFMTLDADDSRHVEDVDEEDDDLQDEATAHVEAALTDLTRHIAGVSPRLRATWWHPR